MAIRVRRTGAIVELLNSSSGAPTMKPIRSLAGFVLIATVFAGCASSSGDLGTPPPASPSPAPSAGSTEPDVTPAPSETPAPSSTAPDGSPGATPSPTQGETTIVRAYFVLGGDPGSEGLVPYLFEVPATKAVASAAINALLDASTIEADRRADLSSAIPAGTKLRDLTIDNGVATIDLSREFESGGGSASAMYRLGQVVYTLTQFSTVRSVVFQIEGQTVTVFGSEGIVLDGPVGRADYVNILPDLFVNRPAFGAALGNPARITGSAQGVFEATFRIAVLGSDGQTIVDQQVMAACMCESGAFDATVRYDVQKAQWGTLRVYNRSAKDGSVIDVRDYPVWLTPAS
jgi:germination protein M